MTSRIFINSNLTSVKTFFEWVWANNYSFYLKHLDYLPCAFANKWQYYVLLAAMSLILLDWLALFIVYGAQGSSMSVVLQGYSFMLTEEIEWPEEEEWQVRDDAKDLIQQLLTHDPIERLGTAGAQEVKEHCFFKGLDWESLLRQKAEFVPHLENEEDTSYFDSEWIGQIEEAA